MSYSNKLLHLDIFPRDFVDFILKHQIAYLQKDNKPNSKPFIISLIDILNQPDFDWVHIGAKNNSKTEKIIFYSLKTHQFHIKFTNKTVDWVSLETQQTFGSWTDLIKIYKPVMTYNVQRYHDELKYLTNKIKFLEETIDLFPPIEGGILYKKSKKHFENNNELLRKSM